MFPNLVRFEFYYQSKQRALPLFAILFLTFGFFLGSQEFAPANLDFNSPYQLTFYISLFSLGCVFPIMFFVISGILRDRQYRFESLVYSTAVGKRAFFWSRYIGIFLFSLMAFSPIIIGFIIGAFRPGLNPDRMAPFMISRYLWPWLIFVLPNVLICTTIIFSVSVLSKNRMATYMSTIAIYALYWICAIFLNSPMLANAVPASPENMAIAAIADPFGISAFFEQTMNWTAFERNAKLLAFSDNFLWNRLLWLSITAGLLAITYRFFSFRQWQAKTKKQPERPATNFTIKNYLPVDITLGQQSHLQCFWSLLKIELSAVFKSLPFIGVLGIWFVIVFTEIYFRINDGGDYSDSLYPTTGLLIWLIEDPLPFLSLILIVFYSGELIWRERSLNIASIIDATPASNITFFLSKFFTLLLLPVILITSSILIAIGFQITEAYYYFEPSLYFGLFYYSGMRLLFYCSLAFFIQIVSPNKYLGMVITGLVFILFGSSMSAYLGIYHPLLRLGYFPEIIYTNMTAYGDYSRPFHYFSIYWTLLGLLLCLFSFQLWRRGSIHSFLFRVKQLRNRWKVAHSIPFALLSLFFICSGATIYYNTNVLNDFTTPTKQLDYMEAYERKFKHLETPRHLFPVDIKTEVDLYPEEGRYQIKAEHTIKNNGDSSIHKIFVSEREPLSHFWLENATLVERDTYFHTQLYQLNAPLLPGEQISYTYELTKEKKGFETSLTLVNNGSYLIRNEYDPVLNYRQSFEIKDPFERKKRNLPEREEEQVNEDHLHQMEATVGKANFETILSTAADQTAIAPGNLVKTWTENDRRVFHYQAPQPILPIINYFSARYKVRKEKYGDIAIELYYHPSHTYNIDYIAQHTKLALDYCIKNFCDYNLDHLRIAEIPGHWYFGGQAMPGTISMVEDRLYLTDQRDSSGFDLVAKRTIHEVAHQWWGMLFSPKNIEGASLLIEGLAKYTEAVVMEKTHGLGAVWQLSQTANRRYFRMRSYASEPEPPLHLSMGEGYLSYGKSFISMLAAKELIGEEKMNRALRQLLADHYDEFYLTATSLDFIEELYRVGNPGDSILIDDWFKRSITYDLKVHDATIKSLANGNYEINVNLSAERFELAQDGTATPISIHEPISIGLFSKHPKNLIKGEEPLYLQNRFIDAKHKTLTIITETLPTHLVIDPFGTRLEEQRSDNIWVF